MKIDNAAVPSMRGIKSHEPELPHRLSWILGFVALGCVIALAFTAIIFGWCPMSCSAPTWLRTFQVAAKSRPPWLLISGLATAPALILTWWWRTTHKDQDIWLVWQAELSKRFFEAAALLAGEKLEARLGALYALEDLVRLEPREYVKVAETICGFLAGRSHVRAYDGRPPIDIQAAFSIVCRLKPEEYDGPSPVELTGVVLPGLHAEGARLPGANLAGSDFSNCSFEGADLEGAILPWVSFENSLLSNARLQGVNLRKANFRGATLDGADLTAAYLESADLQDTKHSGAKFLASSYDIHTKLPSGVDAVNLRFVLVPPIDSNPAGQVP